MQIKKFQPESNSYEYNMSKLIVTSINEQSGNVLTISDIEINGNNIDCSNPHAHKCWQLLHKALTNVKQARHRTNNETIREGIEEFKEFKKSNDLSNTKQIGTIAATAKTAINIDLHGEFDATAKLDSIRSEMQNHPAYGSVFSQMTDNQIIEVATTAHDLLGILKSKTDLYQQLYGKNINVEQKDVHSYFDQFIGEDEQIDTTLEIIQMIDIAVGVGDNEAVYQLMSILEKVNPSAFRAMRCLLGTTTGFSRYVINEQLEENGLDPLQPTQIGSQEFLNIAMALSGSQPIVGGITGITYVEENMTMQVGLHPAIVVAIIGAAAKIIADLIPSPESPPEPPTTATSIEVPTPEGPVKINTSADNYVNVEVNGTKIEIRPKGQPELSPEDKAKQQETEQIKQSIGPTPESEETSASEETPTKTQSGTGGEGGDLVPPDTVIYDDFKPIAEQLYDAQFTVSIDTTLTDVSPEQQKKNLEVAKFLTDNPETALFASIMQSQRINDEYQRWRQAETLVKYDEDEQHKRQMEDATMIIEDISYSAFPQLETRAEIINKCGAVDPMDSIPLE